MSRVIEASAKNNSNRTHESTQFFKDGADVAKKELDAIENQLTEFQMKNNGHLPDQADSNMHSMVALETTLTGLNGSLSRATSDKLQIESNIRILQDDRQGSERRSTTVAAIQRSERVTETERDVQQIKTASRCCVREVRGSASGCSERRGAALAVAVEARGGPEDDVAKRRRSQKEEETKKDGKAEATVARVNPAVFRDNLDRNGRISALQAQAEARELEIAGLNKEIKRTNEQIGMFEARLANAPLGVKQYTDLLRDREMAKAKYLEADDKLSKSQRSQNMEDRNQGERLEPLDTASLHRSTEPKRAMVISIGAGIGLLLGIRHCRRARDEGLRNKNLKKTCGHIRRWRCWAAFRCSKTISW